MRVIHSVVKREKPPSKKTSHKGAGGQGGRGYGDKGGGGRR